VGYASADDEEVGRARLKESIVRQETILETIYDYENRANPYPLFAELRRAPVSWQKDGPSETGTYAVSTYREIVALLHDPRMSSDPRKSTSTGRPTMPSAPYSLIRLDPPEHDRLRRLAMRHFGPPGRPEYLEALRPEIGRITTSLVDALRDERRIDVVARVAYPLPVSVICTILGVPPEDQPRFHQWADAIVRSLSAPTKEGRLEGERADIALNEYMATLVKLRRDKPGDDMLSRMATDTGPEGRVEDPYLVATSALLLIAGHETTVNLIANGVLTLLRHPPILERLRREPDLITGTVEELLRYEPPVHLLSNRTTLEEIPVGGTTIPKGAFVTLVLAAANRDPSRFVDPDRFDPDRPENAHLGFGGGIHYCFGAALARVEAQTALMELVQRLERPRLLVDPPPYRESPLLRGPRELQIEVDGVRNP
jgi:cytochrome P450